MYILIFGVIFYTKRNHKNHHSYAKIYKKDFEIQRFRSLANQHKISRYNGTYL